MMVPDSKNRLEKALMELADAVVRSVCARFIILRIIVSDAQEEFKNDESVTEELLQEAGALLGVTITRSRASEDETATTAATAASASIVEGEEL